MNFFKNLSDKKWLDEREQRLDERERDISKRRMELDLAIEDRDARLRLKEELFSVRETNFESIKAEDKACNVDRYNYEHTFHQERQDRGIELTKLDVAIDAKKELMDALKDQKDTEIRLLKESNEAILNTKNDVIELLKVQVEVLIAKLTELKITDVIAHIDVKSENYARREENRTDRLRV